jgi:hypothetical protein
MLPGGHKLTGFSPDDLDGSAIVPYEQMLLKELANEAKSPSGDNLPEDVSSPRAKREVLDDSTGQRFVEYRARRSFIHGLSRPGLIVERLTNGNGLVLAGRPYPTKAA